MVRNVYAKGFYIVIIVALPFVFLFMSSFLIHSQSINELQPHQLTTPTSGIFLPIVVKEQHIVTPTVTPIPSPTIT